MVSKDEEVTEANPKNAKSALTSGKEDDTEKGNSIEKKNVELSHSTNSKKSANLNVITDSNLSEKSAFKRFNELHEKIEKFTLEFLEKLFECRDTRVMIRARNESKKLASNFSQFNLDFK